MEEFFLFLGECIRSTIFGSVDVYYFISAFVELGAGFMIAQFSKHKEAVGKWRDTLVYRGLLWFVVIRLLCSPYFVYEDLKTKDAQKEAKLTSQIDSLTQKLAASKAIAPMWCILDDNGRPTESSGGAADLIQPVLGYATPGPHGPVSMRIVFNRFINQQPIMSQANSNPFEYTATRGTTFPDEWDFTFKYLNNWPRNGTWSVRMDIPN